MFDAEPRQFGAFSVSGPARPGRFGPIFNASGPAGGAVVVRTFAGTFSDQQRETLVAALVALCDAPLDHAGIVKPVGSGVHEGVPYIVHEWLPGEPLDATLGAGVHCRLEDLLAPLTRIAAALDFAAAAGVYHGGLTAGDILLQDDDAAVVGLGLIQALNEAGIETGITNDVESLARIVYSAIGEQPLRLHVPETALALIAGLQEEFPVADATTVSAEDDLRRPEDDQWVAPGVDIRAASPQVDDVPRPLEPRLTFDSTPERRWAPLALTAVVAGAIGFGGGYMARGSSALDPVAIAPVPAATSGTAEPRVETRTEVAQPPAVEPPDSAPGDPGPRASAPQSSVTEPQPSRSNPQRQSRREPPARPAEAPPARQAAPAVEPARAGSIEVLSRPSGARVFVDGRLAGSTPLVVSNVNPGPHAVRLDLAGHLPWTTQVDVAAGAQVRVAGSLER